jgi:GT2 family glycosyltransferase
LAYPRPAAAGHQRRYTRSPFTGGQASLHEIEISAPLPAIVGDGPAHVLVRLHGRPLGVVEATLTPHCFSPDRLAGVVGETLGHEVAAHLRADGLPEPEPGVPGAVPVHGVATSDACRPQPPDDLAAAVVVTTCAASQSLGRTLAGIQAQSTPPTEIIVVDNRPRTSGAREQLDRLGADVRYVAEPVRGLSRARNAGLAATTAPVVAFTDDDVEVDSRWLEFLLSGFTDDQVACVTGLILPLELATVAQVWFEQFGGFGKGFARRRFDLTGNQPRDPLFPYAAGVFGSGANSAFRTATLRRLGGFDEYLGAGTAARGGEDLDIFLSVVRGGHAVVYEPAALLRHAHKRTTAQLRRQVHDYGVGLGAMVTKRVVTQPAERGEIARLVPEGLRRLLDPGSPKNAGKSRHYPRSLTVAELAGFARGPVEYATSRVRGRLGSANPLY